PRVLVERAVLVQDVDLRERVALSGLVVVRIVRWSDLHDARSELRVDEIGVTDDRDEPLDEWVLDRLAVKGLIARIVGVHGDGRVAEHRLGARRRDHDLPRAILERISEVEELPLNALLLFDLEVA